MVVIGVEENKGWAGPTNIEQVQKYAHDINKIIDDFKELINEDCKDALHITVQALKQRMAKLWPHMEDADSEAVIKCMKEPSCVIL